MSRWPDFLLFFGQAEKLTTKYDSEVNWYCLKSNVFIVIWIVLMIVYFNPEVLHFQIVIYFSISIFLYFYKKLKLLFICWNSFRIAVLLCKTISVLKWFNRIKIGRRKHFWYSWCLSHVCVLHVLLDDLLLLLSIHNFDNLLTWSYSLQSPLNCPLLTPGNQRRVLW